MATKFSEFTTSSTTAPTHLVGYGSGANVKVPIMEAGAANIAYDYVIFTDDSGTTYKSVASSTGAVTSNAAFHTLMTAIMGSGGTAAAPIKIAISGAIAITEPTPVVDYVDITVLGKITGNDVDTIFRNEHFSSSDITVTGASAGATCTIDAVAHGYSTGDFVFLQDLGGMVELNQRGYYITVTTVDAFTLDDVDSTSYTAYTSGGIANLGNRNIRVFGPGIVDGASTQDPISGNQSPFNFHNVFDLQVLNVTAINGGNHCINAASCQNVRVEGCTADNPGDDGISIVNVNGFRVMNNEIRGDRVGNSGSSGIEIEDSSANGIVSGNHVHDTHYGIHTVTDPGSSKGGMRNVLIIGNLVKDTGTTAIDIACNKPGEVNSACGIINNTVINSGAKAIGMTRTVDSVISGNTTDGSTTGIVLAQGCKRIRVADNAVRNTSDVGFSFIGDRTTDLQKIEDITVKNCSVYRPGTFASQKIAFHARLVDGLKIDGLDLVDDRAFGSEQGMQQPLRIQDTLGHIVVMNLYAFGYLNFSSGNTGIIESGTNDSVIGNSAATWPELTATNKGIRVNS